MKKVVLLPFVLFCTMMLLANLDGALPENTAAPNELTCGRAPCHNIPLNVGDSQISITFNGGDNTYMPDSIYPVTVKIQDPMTSRNGFQILALNEDNQNTGTWSLTEPGKMKIIPGIGLPSRKYITHRAAGNLQNEWAMNWKAPAGNVGKVTFYACVLSANDNGMNTGDEVYSTKIEVDYAMPSASGEVPAVYYKIYPVPTKNGVWIELPTGADGFVFSLHHSSGALVKTQKASFGGVHFIETYGLSAGIYFLAIDAGIRRTVKKIVVH